MILQTEIVEQDIDAGVRGRFVKDVIATREGPHPIALVRKRLANSVAAQGSRVGTKAAVLLVHGFGQNRYSWHTSKRSFVNYLANADYDVFNLDLRGRGRSRRFGARHDTGLDDYIRDDLPSAIHSVLRLSGHSQVFLIGHSMGGLISYSVAGTMREQVAGVITVGSPYRFGEGSFLLRIGRPLFYGVRLTGIFDGDPPIPLRLVGTHMRKNRWLWDTRYVPLAVRLWVPGSIEPEILDENLAAAFERTRMGIALGIAAMGAENALKSHDGLVDYGVAFELSEKPLLVIAGSEDDVAPPASVRPVCDRSQSPDKTYREFPMGHLDLVIGRDAPFTVWPLVRTWLDARVERLTQPARSSVTG